MSLLSKKIFWYVFHLRYLTGVQLYIWATATIANSYQESGTYASSCINYAFLSKMWFNHSAQPFCWCTYEVLVSWIISYSLRKNYNSNVAYSLPLSICNLFTEWKVVFDYIWKFDSITPVASEFLHRKAMLQ